MNIKSIEFTSIFTSSLTRVIIHKHQRKWYSSAFTWARVFQYPTYFTRGEHSVGEGEGLRGQMVIKVKLIPVVKCTTGGMMVISIGISLCLWCFREKYIFHIVSNSSRAITIFKNPREIWKKSANLTFQKIIQMSIYFGDFESWKSLKISWVHGAPNSQGFNSKCQCASCVSKVIREAFIRILCGRDAGKTHWGNYSCIRSLRESHLCEFSSSSGGPGALFTREISDSWRIRRIKKKLIFQNRKSLDSRGILVFN